LVELGADVVRVDPPGGGVDSRRWPVHNGRSLYWTGLNQGKRSVNIDMRTSRGQQLVADLIVSAGTCITNLPPADWMNYRTLRTRRPDLVMATISGNGDGTVAVDYTINAALGFPWVTGPRTVEGPVNHVLPAWDLLTAQTTVTAVITAELHRARTGEGSNLKIALADVALSAVAHLGLIAEAQLDQNPRGRFGNDVFGTYGRDFATADGRHVVVIALTRRQWRSLVDATETRAEMAEVEKQHAADLGDEARRWELREAISAILAPWFKARTFKQIRSALDAHAVLWGPYQTFKQMLAEDPRASPRNPLFAQVVQPGLGEVLTAASPIFVESAERVPPGVAPAMGEHTRDVLQDWLGLTHSDLDDLATNGVIARVSEG